MGAAPHGHAAGSTCSLMPGGGGRGKWDRAGRPVLEEIPAAIGQHTLSGDIAGGFAGQGDSKKSNFFRLAPALDRIARAGREGQPAVGSLILDAPGSNAIRRNIVAWIVKNTSALQHLPRRRGDLPQTFQGWLWQVGIQPLKGLVDLGIGAGKQAVAARITFHQKRAELLHLQHPHGLR